MSSSASILSSNQQNKNYPIIERILSDPITFVKAKNPDISTVKPSSYKTFSSTPALSKADSRSSRDLITTDKSDTAEPKMLTTVVKPRSMAELVAAYTGKKFPTKMEKKLLKKLKKQKKFQQEQVQEEVGEELDELKSTPQSESTPELTPELTPEVASADTRTPLKANVESEESSDDADYQTLDEEEDVSVSSNGEDDKSSEGSEDESDNDDEEDDEDDDADLSGDELGHPRLIDTDKEELEDGDLATAPDSKNIKSMSPTPVDEEIQNQNSTPPTSPEDNEESSSSEKPSLYLPDSEFYQIDEAFNDRGSNGSKRIYKNWRNLKKCKNPLGLLNQGVTCYMNAAIQALIHTPLIQHYLADVHNNKVSQISNSSVTKTFADTSAKIWQLDNDGNRKISMINPRKLIRRLQDINCMMSEWQQEDSHEYFMSLMSRLQEDSTPKGMKLNTSIVYDIFGGLLDQSVSCKSCGHVSKTEQEFYDLSLNLDNKRKESQSPEDEEEMSSKRYSIKKSLYDFFSPELIKTDKKDKSGYVCEKCKQRTNALKHNKIKRAPETLAIHLKRFRFNGTSSSKLKTGVSFPSSLDLTNFTVENEPSRYKLISVVVHEGRSVSSGHYIAHCRQPDGTWSTYDDEYVNQTTELHVLKNTSAYFLIYTRLTHKSKLKDWDVSNGKKRKLDNNGHNTSHKRSKK